jgi:hypothetical protein
MVMPLPRINYMLYDIDLPSNGAKIKVRQILAKDEKLLLMAKASTGQDVNMDIMKAITQVVQNCVMTPGIDVSKLPLFDVEYMFIRLRAVSVSNVIKVAYQDKEELDNFQKQLIDIGTQLNLKPGQEIPAEALVQANVKAPEPYKFDVMLDNVKVKFPENRKMEIDAADGIKISLKYPDASLYSDEEFLNLKGEDIIDYMLKNCMASVTQGSKIFDIAQETPEEIKEFLNSLPMNVYDQLRMFLSDLPTLSYELTYKNTFGKEIKIVLNTLYDFFQF